MNRSVILYIFMMLVAGPSLAQAEFDFQQKVVTSLRKAGDSLGSSLAMYGDFAVIGAKGEDYNSNYYNTGAVYVYHKQIDGSWLQIQKIAPESLVRNDFFGFAVSMDENFIVIGVPYKDTLNRADRGTVYVYKKQNNNQWTLFQKLVSTDNLATDFGISVAVRNNTLVIGDWRKNRAHIYELNAQWNLVQSVGSGVNGSFFGVSVATNGTEVVVGADYENRGGVSQAGAAYFYAKNPQGVWELRNRVQPNTLNGYAYFGWSIAMEEEHTVISAYGYNQQNGTRSGSVFVFSRVNSNWVETARLNAADARTGDCFGYTVAINQNRIIVGAPYQDYNSMNEVGLSNAGAAYVYELQDDSWIQLQKLTQNVRKSDSRFGRAVALTCNDLLVGAPRNVTDQNNASSPSIMSGAGYFFKNTYNYGIDVVGGGNYCLGSSVVLSATTNLNATNNLNYEWYDLNTSPSTLLQAGLNANFILYPNQTRMIGVRAVDGCKITSLDTAHIVLPTITNQLATHMDTMTCYVKMGEIVHFFGQTGYITTLQSMEGDLGYVTATVYVEDQPLEVEDCQGNEWFTAVLNRHWKITPESNHSANILLPYANSEWIQLDIQANANSNALDDLNGEVARLHLTKYSAFQGEEATEDGNFENNCGNGNVNTYQGTHGTLQQTNYSVLQPIEARYAFFSIPSFSEFWLHGTTDLIPLGKKLKTIDINCEDQITTMKWEVVESNSIHQFVVLTSDNGYQWREEDTLSYSAASTKYEWSGQSNRKNKYIKLEVLDKDGQVIEQQVDLTKCMESTLTNVQLFPNPTNGKLRVIANEAMQHIHVTDINGRIIESFEGDTMQLEIDLYSYPAGIYLINIHLIGTQITQRVVKQ